MYKSKTVKANLNPTWAENFAIPINLREKLTVRVYDRDKLSSDDFMGCATVDLDRIPDNEVIIKL